MSKTMSLAQAKAKPKKGKAKLTGSPSTEKDAAAQKERGTLDLVRIMAIRNPGITAAEAKAQLPAGKVIPDTSLASVLYEIRKTMSLLRELGMYAN